MATNTSPSLLSFFGIGKGYEPFSEVAEKVSLLRVLGDRQTTLTKGGRLARIIELRGKDYSGMESEVVRSLYQGRKMWFDTTPGNMVVFPQSHRIKTTREIGGEHYNIPLAGQIAERWANNFTESFRTRHFVIICTAVDNLVEKVGMLAEGGGRDELYRALDEYSNEVLIKLKEYSPRLLAGDDVASYWAWLLNGKHQTRKLPTSGWLDDILATTNVTFPNGKRYGIYESDNNRYSAMLYVAAPGTSTDPRFLDGLFRLHHDFSIWQIIRRVEKPAALSEIEDRRRNTVSFKSAGDVILMELHELETRVQADEVTLQRHKFAIEVLADSLPELEKGVQEIRSVIENQGFGIKRESRNHEAQFWSRFPEFDRRVPKGPPNPRERSMTSENAAHFCTFASAGEGLDSCSWGDYPITHFKTPQGSEYAFTFHGQPNKMWPGHTLVIGGNNSGKTTLISFLLAMSTKYPDWRCFIFDRLHGLEVFTRMMGGDYLDIMDGLEVNPLTLPDDAESRAFLSNWFQVLTGKSDDAALLSIDGAIRQTFLLDRKERSLPNIAEAFGLPVEGSIRAALQRWITGQFSTFFTAERDAMDFNRQIVGIDMTTLLDLPEVLAPLSYYLFHKLLIQARGKGGYAVFVDELPRYLANAAFAPKIDMMLQELRKTDGVFIGAAQSIDSVINSPSADKFLTNIETYLLFPEPRARREHFLSEGLRLNDQEYLWLTQTHRPREVLVKRKSGESTVLNVDLSPLGEFINVFNSGADAVAKLNQLRRERHDWQEAFLRGH